MNELNPWKIIDEQTFWTGGTWEGGPGSTKHYVVLYANGQIWESINDKGLHQKDSDNAQVAEWQRLNREAEAAKEPPKVISGQSWNPDKRIWEPAPEFKQEEDTTSLQRFQDEDDNWYTFNPITGEVKPITGIGTGTISEKKQLELELLRTNLAKAKQGPQAPMRAPRYPDEERLAQLNIQKLEREQKNQYMLGIEQAFEAVEGIRQQVESGAITPKQANKMVELIGDNLNATLKGTTPHQREVDMQNLAKEVVGQRMQTGSSMAQGLLSGMGGLFGNILSSTNPPTNFDPLAMAMGFTDQLQGPELAQMAQELLKGAMQGGEGLDISGMKAPPSPQQGPAAMGLLQGAGTQSPQLSAPTPTVAPVHPAIEAMVKALVNKMGRGGSGGRWAMM